jgi:hypothetical protein
MTVPRAPASNDREHVDF